MDDTYVLGLGFTCMFGTVFFRIVINGWNLVLCANCFFLGQIFVCFLYSVVSNMF